MRFGTRATWIVVAALVGTSVTPGSDEPGATNGKLFGEVVAVEQHARLQNQGDVTEIKVRTRNQQEHWLRLGPSEQIGDAVQVGDRIRARYRQSGTASEPAQVRTMLNYRNGARIRVNQGQRTMVQNPFQYRDGTGSGSENCELCRWKHQGTAGNGPGRGGGGQRGGSGQRGSGAGGRGGR